MNYKKKAPLTVREEVKKLYTMGVPVALLAIFAEVSFSTINKYLNRKIATDVSHEPKKEKVLLMLKLYAWIITDLENCKEITQVSSIGKFEKILHGYLSLRNWELFLTGALSAHAIMCQNRFSDGVSEEYRNFINAIFPPQKRKINGREQVEEILKKMHKGKIEFPDASEITHLEKVFSVFLNDLSIKEKYGQYFDEDFVVFLDSVLHALPEWRRLDIQYHYLLVRKHPDFIESRTPGTIRQSCNIAIHSIRHSVLRAMRGSLIKIVDLEFKLSKLTNDISDLKEEYKALQKHREISDLESSMTLDRIARLLGILHHRYPDDPTISETFKNLNSDYVEPKGFLLTKLNDLDLSVRAINVLDDAKVKYLWQIAALNPEDFMKLRNCGKKTILEIEKLLQEKGLSFGMKF